MYKDVLNHMEHATWYAQAGLIIFIVVFVFVAIRALSARRTQVDRWASLPLEDEHAEHSKAGGGGGGCCGKCGRSRNSESDRCNDE